MTNVKRFMPNRKRLAKRQPAVIGLIVVCIVATAILIAARSPEPTTSATAVKGQPAAAPVVATPAAPSVETTVVDAKPAAQPQSADAAQSAGAVTIEGCLVQDNDTYRLKNTSGEEAPKGRSWKSGFLHRGSKTLDVVDARHRLNLAGHAGQRVSVTGVLDDKELQGTSIKRVAASCN
jgi:hypothetical protein